MIQEGLKRIAETMPNLAINHFAGDAGNPWSRRRRSPQATSSSLQSAYTPREGGNGSLDVQISSAQDRSLSFTFLPDEVAHPLTTWVDCGVRDGERAEVDITGVTPPNRYSGRVFADPAVHEVDVGDLTPVPSVPAAAAVLLGAVLAGLGALRLRRVARVDDPSEGTEPTTRTPRPAETRTAARTRIEPEGRPPNENQPSRGGDRPTKPLGLGQSS